MQRTDFTNSLVLFHFDRTREATNNLMFYFACTAESNDKQLVFSDSDRADLGWPSHVNNLYEYRMMFVGVYERLYQFCVISLCSDVEAFFKAIFEKHGYAKGKGGFFQRFDDVIAALVGEGFDFSAVRDSMAQLRLAFQVRHIAIHNMGIADDSFINKTGLGNVGRPFPIDQASYRKMFAAYEIFLKHLDGKLPK